MQRFEVYGVWHYDNTGGFEIRCTRCGSWEWSPDWDPQSPYGTDDKATLAELVQRADEHTEVCR
jgi:hypothetical protein